MENLDHQPPSPSLTYQPSYVKQRFTLYFKIPLQFHFLFWILLPYIPKLSILICENMWLIVKLAVTLRLWNLFKCLFPIIPEHNYLVPPHFHDPILKKKLEDFLAYSYNKIIFYMHFKVHKIMTNLRKRKLC